MSRLRTAAVAFALAVALARAATHAWVGEDAFITFRVIDNVANGLGLRWNPSERVQVYTHPAWLALNAGAYLLTREVANTTTAVALACTALAVALLARGRWGEAATRADAIFPAAVVALAWASSPTLARYATSGFETSLTMAIVSAFALAIARAPGARALGLATLAAAIGAVNRLDLAVLFAPPLLVAARGAAARDGVARCARAVAAGALPLAAWLAFAALYYGSVVPNTALAKLAPGVPRGFYVREGLRYVADLAQRDPAAAIAVLAAAACAAIGVAAPRGARAARAGDPPAHGARAPARAPASSSASARARAGLALGALAYAGYAVAVGGDFLSGRFLVPSVWASVAVVAASLPALRAARAAAARGDARPLVAGAGAALLVALFALAGVVVAWRTPAAGPIHALSLARLELGLDGRWTASPMARVFAARGEALRAEAERSATPVVAVQGEIGFAGFAAGPRVEIVDPHALGDAFLARRAPDPARPWRIGHLPRALPDGYLEARRTGDARALAPELRPLFARVELLARAPLWSAKRLRAIASGSLAALASDAPDGPEGVSSRAARAAGPRSGGSS